MQGMLMLSKDQGEPKGVNWCNDSWEQQFVSHNPHLVQEFDTSQESHELLRAIISIWESVSARHFVLSCNVFYQLIIQTI